MNHLVTDFWESTVTDLKIRIWVSPWIFNSYLFERLQNRTISSTTTKVSWEKWQQLYMYTTNHRVMVKQNYDYMIQLWKLYIWTNLRAPFPCLPALVPGCSGTLCTWSSPFPEYKTRTGHRGSPSCFATCKHILHIFTNEGIFFLS